MNITYRHAIKVIEASIEKAEVLGVAVSIAVVDVSGYLVAFARLDHNGDMIDFAVKKAKKAVMFDEGDDRLEIMAVRTSVHAQRMLDFKKSVLTIAGTAEIKNNQGKLIGIIASSGGSPDQDKDIADTGAKAFFLFEEKCSQLS